MKKIRTKHAFTQMTLFALLALVVSSSAMAQTVGSVADSTVSSGAFSGFLDLLVGIAYVVGGFFGFKAALQLRDHADSPQNVKIGVPMTSALVATLMLALPSLFASLRETFSLTGDIMGAYRNMSAGSSGAATDISGMAVALAANIPALAKLVSLGATCAGAFLIFRAVLLLPQAQQGRVEGSKIFWLMISGVGLWSLLPMITMAMGTMGMTGTDPGNLLTAKYNQSKGGGFDGTIAAVLTFIQFLGLIAFVRGMLILKALGEHKEGAMGRALTHIGGGSAAMNISWFVGVLARSIGAQGAICGLSAVICG